MRCGEGTQEQHQAGETKVGSSVVFPLRFVFRNVVVMRFPTVLHLTAQN